jgi:hypothetical protein
MSCGEEYQGAPYLRLVEESHEVKVSIATLSAKTHWRDWCDGRPIGAVSLNGFVRPARKASSCSKSYGWVMVVTGEAPPFPWRNSGPMAWRSGCYFRICVTVGLAETD